MRCKILVITGPTATGKTALGIELAKKCNSEILSADSRQVYVGRDVETGKDKELYKNAGVKVWGLDIVQPGYTFSVSDFVSYARKVIADITKRGKLPIIVGGTGQYIKELLDPAETLHIPPDPKLRERLLNCSTLQLQGELRKVDRDRWGRMNSSDRQNPRRLVRAIEVAVASQELKENRSLGKNDSLYDILMIGLTAPRQVLCDRIRERRRERSDLVMKEFGLAKKQLAYMQKFLKPVWFDISEPDYHDEIFSRVEKWYTKANGG